MAASKRDRDTYVHRVGVTPETASVISSKNKIYAIPADDETLAHQIGVVASFNPSESRSIEPVRGIGYGDHVAELVPGLTEPMSISIDRTAQYLSMIFQVFGYKGGVDGIVRSLRHHKWPFDLVQELVMSAYTSEKDTGTGVGDGFAADGNIYKAIMTYYEGCWMSDWGIAYGSDTALVQENVTINVTDIISGTGTEYSEGSTELFNDNAKSKIMGTERIGDGIFSEEFTT